MLLLAGDRDSKHMCVSEGGVGRDQHGVFLITLNLMFEMESFTEPPVRGLLAWLTALWGLPVIAPQHWGSCTHLHTLLFVVILCGC